MRMSAADFEALKALITKHDTAERRARYKAGAYPRAHLTKDLNVRYRWDLYYYADARVSHSDDLKTAHIDTALKIIVPLF